MYYIDAAPTVLRADAMEYSMALRFPLRDLLAGLRWGLVGGQSAAQLENVPLHHRESESAVPSALIVIWTTHVETRGYFRMFLRNQAQSGAQDRARFFVAVQEVLEP